MSKKIHEDGVKAKGFFRLQVTEEGRVVGDTGWQKNQVTNLGFDQYLCQTLAGMAGSKTVGWATIGSGTVPDASHTTLNGEIEDDSNLRVAVTPTTIASKTVQFAFTVTTNSDRAAATIQNVGLFNTSSVTTGTLFAGNTYTTSAFANNQQINGSYQIRFS